MSDQPLIDRVKQHYAVHKTKYMYAFLAVLVIVIIILSVYVHKYKSTSHYMGRALAGPNGGYNGYLGAGGPGINKVTDAGGPGGSNVHRNRDLEDFGSGVEDYWHDAGSTRASLYTDMTQKSLYADPKQITAYGGYMTAADANLTKLLDYDTAGVLGRHASQERAALDVLQALPSQTMYAPPGFY